MCKRYIGLGGETKDKKVCSMVGRKAEAMN